MSGRFEFFRAEDYEELIHKLESDRWENQKDISAIWNIAYGSEMDMSSYDEIDVDELNNDMSEIFEIVEELNSRTGSTEAVNQAVSDRTASSS